MASAPVPVTGHERVPGSSWPIGHHGPVHGSVRGGRWRLGGALAAMLALAGLSAATVTTPEDPPDDLALARVDGSPTAADDAAGPTNPTSTSTSTPTTTAPTSRPTSTEPPRRRLVIHGVGDTNFDPGYIPNLATFGYDYAFDGLGRLFEFDDLTVVNLECAPSELGQRVPKTFNFRCDPASLPVAAANGVEAANLANNHVLDYGVEAMLDGRANVEAAGIAAVGIGSDVTEATTPAILDIGGWSVAVLGMGGVVPAAWWLATDDRPGMASGDDIDQMVAAVAAADADADLVIVSIHWGQELVTEPDAGDRARAEAMIAAGADVIFGHHSHRLGPVEEVDGRPVFWTLGNFVWPRLSDAGATTGVARAVIEPDGTIESCIIPAFIANSGQPRLTGPPPCGPGARPDPGARRSEQ